MSNDNNGSVGRHNWILTIFFAIALLIALVVATAVWIAAKRSTDAANAARITAEQQVAAIEAMRERAAKPQSPADGR